MIQHNPVTEPATTPHPFALEVATRILGASLRKRDTGELCHVTGLRYSTRNSGYIAFELDHFAQCCYSLASLKRDFEPYTAPRRPAQAEDFYRQDGCVRVITLYEGGSILLDGSSLAEAA